MCVKLFFYENVNIPDYPKVYLTNVASWTRTVVQLLIRHIYLDCVPYSRKPSMFQNCTCVVKEHVLRSCISF